MGELVFIESLGIALGLTFVLLVIGIVVIIILVLIFYQYKAKVIRQVRERHVQQLRRRNRSRSREIEETIEEEGQHTTSTTHRGEAPPAYKEAIVSKDYRSVSLESLNKLGYIYSESTDNKIKMANVTETHHCDDETSPPPYVYISDTPTRSKTQ